MENIRNIKERIQSCMSCNESQCSRIKERLGHHVMSHHASFKHSTSNIQQMKPTRKNSGVIFTSTSTLSDHETSTSDLNYIKRPERNIILNYKEVLRPAILECIKNIIVDQNGSHEEEIQNIINEFIEKIVKIYREYHDNVKLESVIGHFLSSLPLSSEKYNETNVSNLKNKILNKVNELHKYMKKNKTNKIETNMRSSKNSLTESFDSVENFETRKQKNSEARNLIKSLSGSFEPVTRLHSEDGNKISKKMIDKPVQYSFTDIITNENSDLKEINFKKIILNWLFQLNKEGYLHIASNNLESIMKELYKRIRSFLVTKVYKPNVKLLLKGEIISVLSDYVTPNTYNSQLNKLAENLAILLLSEKSNDGNSFLPQLNTYFFNEAQQMIGVNDESETNLKPLLLEIVNNNLARYGVIDCNSLNRDITEILSENLHLINEGDEHQLENQLLNLLTFSKDLSDITVKDITNSIINNVRNVTARDIFNYNKNNTIQRKDNWCLGKSVSVYMSENELYGHANSSSISISKRKSGIIKKKPSYLNTLENIYTEKLTALITAWIETLPKVPRNSKDITFKGNLINNLIADILDQVELEQIAPETSNQKDKYISFFIFRWLNRYEIFENIDEAKPYVEQLTRNIKEISVPILKRPKISNNKSIENIHLTSNKSSHKGYLLSFQDLDELRSVILNWINEQPTTLFLHVSKSTKQKISHDLAMKLQGNINERSPEQVVREIKYWLEKIINPEEIQYVSSLANTLLKKFETSILNFYDNNRINLGNKSHNISCHDINVTNSFTETYLRELISKYLEYNNDSNNLITKGAITQIFKNVLNELSFSDFDEKILTNSNYEDSCQLEACVLGLYKEIHKITNRNLTSLSKTRLTNKSGEISLPDDEMIKRFSLKATYVKEISEWLNNFPLLPLTDKTNQDHLVIMISNLAEKMSESYHAKIKNPCNTRIDTELADYLTNWIFELPLDPSKEIVLPVVIQQIVSRIEQISGAKLQRPYHTEEASSKSKGKSTSNMYKFSQTKTVIDQKSQDPAEVIVETIENWCHNLPVKTENEDISRTLKEKVATRLYQKLVELNMNPKYLNNNFLYEEMLSEEIDVQLQSLPQSSKLQSSKNELKEQLLEVVIEQRKQIREKALGADYKQDLEKTIDMSIPYPISMYQEDNPAFKMYKDRLANMFILENFDHSNQVVKLNYVKRLEKEIDVYFKEIQVKNSSPVSRDEMSKELYSALFNVPFPNESSMIDEVEEIKTRCEIDDWFESLPLKEVTDMSELLERDQILAMLAKRLHEMEKYHQDPDNKMHKEITKWLVRLPLLPHQTSNISALANDLQRRLKSTFLDRKYVQQNSIESNQLVVDRQKSVLDFQDSAGHSENVEVTPMSLLPKCCQISSIPKSKKSADKILEIVEMWCQELPLPANTPQEKDNVKLIKDNLLIKIIMKINELNINPETFEDDFLYDELLDDELEHLMSNLPASYEFIQSKNERKNQLKEAIKSVKSIIKDEKARYEYKLQLKNTVNKVLTEPRDDNPEKSILFNTLREEIADSFIVYSFNDDDKSRQICRTLVHSAVEKYFSLVAVDNDNKTKYNSLITGNQLLCELSKIPAPGEDIIRDEIKELKIKFELTKFFDNLFLTKDTNKLALKTQIKSSLARRLSDFADVAEGNQKMKQEIIKSLKKIDEEIDSEKVDQFIKRLKSAEFQNKIFVSNIDLNVSSYTNDKQTQRSKDSSINDKSEDRYSKRNTKDEPWLSSLPANEPAEERLQINRKTLELKKLRKTLQEIGSPKEHVESIDHSFDESGINYKTFEDSAATSLSSYEQDSPQVNRPYGYTSIAPNQNISFKTKSSHRLNLDIDIRNQERNEYTQSNEFQQDLISQERSFQTNIPKSRTFESPYMFNQYTRKQTTLVRSPQIPSQIQMPDQREILSSTSINRRDAVVQGTGRSIMPTPPMPASNKFPNSFQNIQECRPPIPSPFVPSTSRCIPERPVSYSRRIPPCRRPPITVCRPTEPQGYDNEQSHIFRGCNAKNPECKMSEDQLENNCECYKKRKRQQICSVHMKRHCKICNGAYSYQYRMPPYRYQDFYNY